MKNVVLFLACILVALPLYAQEVVNMLPYDMRPIRAMDWLPQDTTSFVGVGDAVIRSLPGEPYAGMEAYGDVAFDAVAIVNDSVGIATSRDGLVVGLNTRTKRIQSWPGLPARGMRVMRCGTTAVMMIGTTVSALVWDGGGFQRRELQATAGSVAHCAVTDSTLACSGPDSTLTWVNINTDGVIRKGLLSFNAVWLHPLHATAVVARTENWKFYRTRLDKKLWRDFSARGLIRHLVGFTARNNGESVVWIWHDVAGNSTTQQDMYYGLNAWSEGQGELGLSGKLPESGGMVTAGISMPDYERTGKAYAVTGSRSILGYLDSNRAMIDGPQDRRSLKNEGWTFAHSQDGRFICLLSTNGSLTEYAGWSQDGGSTWTAEATPRLFSVRQLLATSSGEVYVRTNAREVIRMAVPGMKLDTVWGADGMPQGKCVDMVAYDDTLMVLTNDSLDVSTDRGQTWTRIPYPYDRTSDVYDAAICYSNRNQVVVSDRLNGRFYLTYNWGTTWTSIVRSPSWTQKPTTMLHASNGQWYVVDRQSANESTISTWDGVSDGFVLRDTFTGDLIERPDGTLWKAAGLGFVRIDRETLRPEGMEELGLWPWSEMTKTTSIVYSHAHHALVTYGQWMRIIGGPVVTGVYESDTQAQDITAYPNPANDYIVLAEGDVVVRSLQGLEICRVHATPSLRIHVGLWSAGIYVIERIHTGRRSTSIISIVH